MPHTQPTATEAALLNWINTFPLESEVESLVDLTDGRVLSLMLEDLDPAYAVELEKPTPSSKWLAKKRSLEAVYKSLLRYVRVQCPDLDPVTLENPADFNAIAEHDDVEQTIKVLTYEMNLQFGLTDICFELLTMFLLAAVHGTNKAKYINTIQNTLDLTSQNEIASVIQRMQTNEKNTDVKAVDQKVPLQDIELALEEEHAKLSAAYTELKKKHADYITRFRRLEESHAELQEHSSDIESRLRVLQDSDDGDKVAHIKDLITRLQEANDLIANQEQQVETDRVTKERQEKELGNLRPSAQRLIQIEDQLNELKVENTTLTRKANKVDHYQKKLENLQNIEKENAHLREQIETLELNMREFDKVNEDKSKMEQTIREFKSLISNLELENVTLIQNKNRLDEEVRFRDDQIQKLHERQQHDEKFIKELQEQFNTDAAGRSPQSPSTGANLTLEQELEQSDDPAPNYALEISRLRAENQVLKSSTGGVTNANLRVDLEEAERIRKRLQENLQGLLEKHTIAQHQLNAALSTSPDPKSVTLLNDILKIGPYKLLTNDVHRDEAFRNLQKLYRESTAELASTKSKLEETQSRFQSQERDLLDAKADLEAVNQDEIDALETLKETNESITTSLQNDLVVLQNAHKNITIDFDQQKTHLLNTLLVKDQLIKDLADARADDGSNSQLDGKEKAEVSHGTDSKPVQSLSTHGNILKKIFRPFRPQRPRPESLSAAPKTDARTQRSRPEKFSAAPKTNAHTQHSRPESSSAAPKTDAHTQHSRPESSSAAPKTDTHTNLDPELARELAAIGTGAPVELPTLSPRFLPLPMSPVLIQQVELTLLLQIQKQELVIQDLQRRLKMAEESSPDAQKAANESMIKNLTRENALIATAWYDLSSRLQSNHVVLQRRQDAPKSWLNKQRQMVNPTPRR
ncbi:Protein Hook-like protein [Lachnellula occidentalis]|uniref:Protein Hook-like protein n=1 Tax=Lachnellula occidentalis TaxID=215460 RepID=A0A8H8RV92_9HELO|nr:Protein Hook-like protein [Lachnellula occidentalis]